MAKYIVDGDAMRWAADTARGFRRNSSDLFRRIELALTPVAEGGEAVLVDYLGQQLLDPEFRRAFLDEHRREVLEEAYEATGDYRIRALLEGNDGGASE